MKKESYDVKKINHIIWALAWLVILVTVLLLYFGWKGSISAQALRAPFRILFVLWTISLVLLLVLSQLQTRRTRRNEEKLLSSERNLKKLLEEDQLTGMLNRHAAIEKLDQTVASDRVFSLVLADVVGMREINEIYGHEFGDKVLKTIASGLIRFMEGKNILGARYGNDEFLLIFIGRHMEKDDPEVGEICRIFQEPVQIGLASISAHANIGIANSDGKSSPSSLIADADIALSEAKELGDDEASIFSDQMKSNVEYKNMIRQTLLSAVENDGFYMLYQPKVAASDLRVVGYEALVRLRDRNISPAVFIPIAEENGLLREIGRITTEKVIQQLAEWRDQGHALLPVSINFSSIQIRDTGYTDFLLKCLDYYNIPHSFVEIELTESIVLEHSHQTEELMNRFHKEGIRLLIDDFGSGYSAFSYLTYLPLDALKVDKSLVDEYLQDEKRKLLLRDVIHMGHDLGMEVIVEGVETAEQYQTLKTFGADTIQGYYFSRPIPADEAVGFQLKKEQKE